jgi:hypothetical protein
MTAYLRFESPVKTETRQRSLKISVPSPRNALQVPRSEVSSQHAQPYETRRSEASLL